MLAINSSIPSKILETPEDVEVLTVQLPVDNPVSLCLLYNAPSSDTEYQKKLLSYLTMLMNPILL